MGQEGSKGEEPQGGVPKKGHQARHSAMFMDASVFDTPSTPTKQKPRPKSQGDLPVPQNPKATSRHDSQASGHTQTNACLYASSSGYSGSDVDAIQSDQPALLTRPIKKVTHSPKLSSHDETYYVAAGERQAASQLSIATDVTAAGHEKHNKCPPESAADLCGHRAPVAGPAQKSWELDNNTLRSVLVSDSISPKPNMLNNTGTCSVVEQHGTRSCDGSRVGRSDSSRPREASQSQQTASQTGQVAGNQPVPVTGHLAATGQPGMQDCIPKPSGHAVVEAADIGTSTAGPAQVDHKADQQIISSEFVDAADYFNPINAHLNVNNEAGDSTASTVNDLEAAERGSTIDSSRGVMNKSSMQQRPADYNIDSGQQLPGELTRRTDLADNLYDDRPGYKTRNNESNSIALNNEDLMKPANTTASVDSANNYTSAPAEVNLQGGSAGDKAYLDFHGDRQDVKPLAKANADKRDETSSSNDICYGMSSTSFMGSVPSQTDLNRSVTGPGVTSGRASVDVCFTGHKDDPSIYTGKHPVPPVGDSLESIQLYQSGHKFASQISVPGTEVSDSETFTTTGLPDVTAASINDIPQCQGVNIQHRTGVALSGANNITPVNSTGAPDYKDSRCVADHLNTQPTLSGSLSQDIHKDKTLPLKPGTNEREQPLLDKGYTGLSGWSNTMAAAEKAGNVVQTSERLSDITRGMDKDEYKHQNQDSFVSKASASELVSSDEDEFEDAETGIEETVQSLDTNYPEDESSNDDKLTSTSQFLKMESSVKADVSNTQGNIGMEAPKDIKSDTVSSEKSEVSDGNKNELKQLPGEVDVDDDIKESKSLDVAEKPVHMIGSDVHAAIGSSVCIKSKPSDGAAGQADAQSSDELKLQPDSSNQQKAVKPSDLAPAEHGAKGNYSGGTVNKTAKDGQNQQLGSKHVKLEDSRVENINPSKTEIIVEKKDEGLYTEQSTAEIKSNSSDMISDSPAGEPFSADKTDNRGTVSATNRNEGLQSELPSTANECDKKKLETVDKHGDSDVIVTDDQNERLNGEHVTTVDTPKTQNSDTVNRLNTQMTNTVGRLESGRKEKPETQKPETVNEPEMHEPKTVDKPKSQKPDTVEKPETPKPESIDKPETQKPETVDKPETQDSGNLDKSETQMSETVNKPETQKPETVDKPETQKPETVDKPELQKPETVDKPETQKPETVDEPETQKPETVGKPELQKPETVDRPETQKSETVDQPETQDAEKVDIPETQDSENVDKSETQKLETVDKPELQQPETVGETEPQKPETVVKPETQKPETVDKTETGDAEIVDKPESQRPETVDQPETHDAETVDKPETQKPETVDEHETQKPETVDKPETQKPETVDEHETQRPETEDQPETLKPETVGKLETLKPETVGKPELQKPETVDRPETQKLETVDQPETQDAEKVDIPETQNSGNVDKSETQKSETVGKPESQRPETVDKPETHDAENVDKPETQKPETVDKPETQKPVTVDKPETQKPEIVDEHETHDADNVDKSETPETVDKPESQTPETVYKPDAVSKSETQETDNDNSETKKPVNANSNESWELHTIESSAMETDNVVAELAPVDKNVIDDKENKELNSQQESPAEKTDSDNVIKDSDQNGRINTEQLSPADISETAGAVKKDIESNTQQVNPADKSDVIMNNDIKDVADMELSIETSKCESSDLAPSDDIKLVADQPGVSITSDDQATGDVSSEEQGKQAGALTEISDTVIDTGDDAVNSWDGVKAVTDDATCDSEDVTDSKQNVDKLVEQKSEKTDDIDKINVEDNTSLLLELQVGEEQAPNTDSNVCPADVVRETESVHPEVTDRIKTVSRGTDEQSSDSDITTSKQCDDNLQDTDNADAAPGSVVPDKVDPVCDVTNTCVPVDKTFEGNTEGGMDESHDKDRESESKLVDVVTSDVSKQTAPTDVGAADSAPDNQPPDEKDDITADTQAEIDAGAKADTEAELDAESKTEGLPVDIASGDTDTVGTVSAAPGESVTESDSTESETTTELSQDAQNVPPAGVAKHDGHIAAGESDGDVNAAETLIPGTEEMQSKPEQAAPAESETAAASSVSEMQVCDNHAITQTQDPVNTVSGQEDPVNTVSEQKDLVNTVYEQKDLVNTISEHKDLVNTVSEQKDLVNTVLEQEDPVYTISEPNGIVPSEQISKESDKILSENATDPEEAPLSRGSYNIDWDNLDPDFNPFASKPGSGTSVMKPPTQKPKKAAPASKRTAKKPKKASGVSKLDSKPSQKVNTSAVSQEVTFETPAKPAKVPTPKRYEGIRELDEEENWKERTSVITKEEHLANCQLAQDILDEIIQEEKPSSGSGKTDITEGPVPAVTAQSTDTLKQQSEHEEQPNQPEPGKEEAETKMEVTDIERAASPPLPARGSYNIDFDHLDDNINPFQPRVKMGSSPPRDTVLPNKFDEEPIKPPQDLASPKNSPAESLKTDKLDTCDKPELIQNNNEGETTEPIEKNELVNSIDQENQPETKKTSPKKKAPALKKPGFMKKKVPRRPPPSWGNKGDSDEIQIFMPGENKSPETQNTEEPKIEEVTEGSNETSPSSADTPSQERSSTESNIDPSLELPPGGGEPDELQPSAIEDLAAVSDSLPADSMNNFLDPCQAEEIGLENEQFIPGEIFNNPSAFDMLEKCGSSTFKESSLARESLYVKFDPLVNVSDKQAKPVAVGRQAIARALPQVVEDEPGITLMGTPSKKVLPSEAVKSVQDVDKLLSCSPKPECDQKKGVEEEEEEMEKLVQVATEQVPSQEVRLTIRQLQLQIKAESMGRQEAEMKRQETEEKMQKLLIQHEEHERSYQEMQKLVEGYEKTVNDIVDLMMARDTEKEAHEKNMNDFHGQISEVRKERDQAQEDLRSVERAFSDLVRRYENLKASISDFKTNEEKLKKIVEDQTATIQKKDEKYKNLRIVAEKKLSDIHEEVEQMKEQHNAEIARLTAAQRRGELQARSWELQIQTLEQQLDQKTKENKELSAICDELLAKAGHK